MADDKTKTDSTKDGGLDPIPDSGADSFDSAIDLDAASPGAGAGEIGSMAAAQSALDPDIAAVVGEDKTQDDISVDGVIGAADGLAAVKKERDALKDQALRALAEAENMRQRTEREIRQAKKYGHGTFARDLLSVVDNLGRAVKSLPEDRTTLDEAMGTLAQGVEMINKEFLTVLGRHGITPIDPLGERFDYERHQAMFEVESTDTPPGTVIQVAQAGWMLHDRLLSPAMVGLAKAPSTTKGEADSGGDTSEDGADSSESGADSDAQ